MDVPPATSAGPMGLICIFSGADFSAEEALSGFEEHIAWSELFRGQTICSFEERMLGLSGLMVQ
jgi:hypothetical protein